MVTPATAAPPKPGTLTGNGGDNKAPMFSKHSLGSLGSAQDKGNPTVEAPKRPFQALMTSRLANQSIPKMRINGLDFMAADANDSDSSNNEAMDKIRAQLNDQSARLQESVQMSIQPTEGPFGTQAMSTTTASNSVPITPALGDFSATAPFTRPSSAIPGDTHGTEDEVVNLRLQLAHAESQITDYRHELAYTRSPFNTENEPHAFAAATSLAPAPQDASMAFTAADENMINVSEMMPFAGNYSGRLPGPRSASTMWSSPKNMYAVTSTQAPTLENSGAAAWAVARGPMQGYMDPTGPYSMAESQYINQRAGERVASEQLAMPRAIGARRGGRPDSRYQSPGPYGAAGYGNFGHASNIENTLTAFPMGGAANMAPVGTPMGVPFGGYPGAINTPLSPHATEFTSNSGWRNEAIAIDGQTYMPTTEPINYRRLLDRSVSCNWGYIVEKIVCQHDQQASIFLQQKLKVSSPEQKFEIVDAIIGKAYPLMVNRFGNFLVQRCFEHGTPEQVIKIAESIRTHTVTLSMDAFGCHVIQKAFDSVPEEYKAMMVNELLVRIPETIIHRYACHVWQKLFELRWQETPPQIMKYVNEALRTMWHEVALGETGSLVVQNIFENCLEEDKRPCVEEVLANIDIVSHGQFGNWCIQHICEHGAPADRSRAIDHVIRYASEYSTDQYASKVVEKCLKIGGSEFLGRYLDRVCEGRPDRPRLPLIDIASDQYGNYLVQYILTNSNPQHREIVMSHIRKHMVSLRGSKFGSRVGMLCTNPAVATRPGPAVGPGIGNPRGMGHHGGARYSSTPMYR